MTPDQIIATVIAILSAAPADQAFPVIAAGGATADYPVVVEACPRPLPAAEVEGQTVICGRVDVPERHDHPQGPRIALSFAVLIPTARGRPEIDVSTLIKLFEDRNSFGHWPGATGRIPLIVTEWDRGESGTYDLLASGATARAPDSGELLKPHAGRMTPDQAVIALLLLEGAAGARREDQVSAYALSSLSDSLSRTARGVTSLAERLDRMMTDAIVATRSKTDTLRFVGAYAALARQTPDRTTLHALIVNHLPANAVAPTLALLDQLTDGDVAEVFADVSKEARTIYKPMVDVLDLMVVACTEDIPFNSRETMRQVIDGLKFKFLAKSDNVDDSIYDL